MNDVSENGKASGQAGNATSPVKKGPKSNWAQIASAVIAMIALLVVAENGKASPQAADAMSPVKEKRPKSNWAQIASAAVAVIALVFIVIQIQTIKDNNRDTAIKNRESAARQMFRSHLELELNNPKLLVQDFSKIKDGDDVERYRYGVLVNHLLYTCEELVTTMVDDKGWHDTCVLRLWPHAWFLCDPKLALHTYHQLMRSLVGSIRWEAGNDGVTECATWIGQAN